MGIFKSHVRYRPCHDERQIGGFRIRQMKDIDLTDKAVIIRVDLNCPMENGEISNDAKIRAILPTLALAKRCMARVLLLSHLGRPKEGEYDPNYSLKPIAKRLSELLKQPVRLSKRWLEGIPIMSGEIVLGENVRFNVGEEANDEALSRKMASLCDVFIMDAFASAHRAHASTVGIAKYAPIAAAGPLLTAELHALSVVMKQAQHPLVAIVGGAKVSSKLSVLKSLLDVVDVLIVGGGIANTFIAALGHPVGSSLYEPELIAKAKELQEYAKQRKVNLIIPEDVVLATENTNNAKTRISNCDDIQTDEKILDVGPKTTAKYADILKNAGTILWNGPVGVFEIPAFEAGTKALSMAIADSKAFSVAGGGETLAAIDKYDIKDKISYVSTGGGAFLEYLEGKILPAVAILEARKDAKL